MEQTAGESAMKMLATPVSLTSFWPGSAHRIFLAADAIGKLPCAREKSGVGNFEMRRGALLAACRVVYNPTQEAAGIALRTLMNQAERGKLICCRAWPEGVFCYASLAAFGAAAQARTVRPPGRPSAERPDVARFRQRVEAALTSNGADRAYWGAVVLDAETGETLYSLNADHYFKPASNVKLFTTTMALATLGPDFRVRTTIETRGRWIRAGLSAVIWCWRAGRPQPIESNFPVRQARGAIGSRGQSAGGACRSSGGERSEADSGDVVADDSYFVLARFPSGWTVDDTVWSYGAAVSAIAVNENSLRRAYGRSGSRRAGAGCLGDRGRDRTRCATKRAR